MDWKMAPADMATAAEMVIARLIQKGHEAYWVGGCIRDELLGRPVHDMDLTTSALPDEVIAIFARSVPTGLVHGTVTVLQGGYGFEVTTYRTESGYVDHRRPEHVFFVSDVKEDLRRRDFTINAICCGFDGVLMDPFGGEKDLDHRLIRCVGGAEERFDEDALRMLRCVRFASVLDFSVAKNTWRGLLRQRDKLAHIAVERVRAELERIVEGPHPRRGLGMLARSGLLQRGKAPFPWTGQVMAAAAAMTSGIGELESARLRWALLLHALGASATAADELLRAWTFPGTTRSAVVLVLRVREAWTAALEAVPPGNPGGTDVLRRQWIAAVLAFGVEAADGWLALLEVLPATSQSPSTFEASPQVSRNLEATPQVTGVASSQSSAASNISAAASQTGLSAIARDWILRMPVTTLAELAVTGNELTEALSKRPGPWLGRMLSALLQGAASGDIPNDKQLLLLEAKRMDGYEQ